MKITYKQFVKAKVGTIIGLMNGGKNPFVYGVKIDDKRIKEVTPVYFQNKLDLNATGSERIITGFGLSRHKQIPDGIFKKRIRRT